MRTGLIPMHTAIVGERLPFLQQGLAELFPGQLPDDAFHLQVKEGSQNFAGIQPSRVHQVVDGPGFFRAQQLVNPFVYWI
jgi:hypothetical protein